MRGFLAVFEREVSERRLLVAASLVLGLVPLAAPWIPGLAQRGGPDLRTAMALLVALCFSFGLALILGASIIAGDLAERRLGFYFSRPIPGWAVWAGKLAAAAGLALCVGALILLPSSLAEWRLQLSGWWNEPTGNTAAACLWVAAVLLLAALGHAGSVALRSHSPWLILDCAGLGVTSWLAWFAMRRLAVAGAHGAASLTTTALLALALVALIAAGAVQVLKGRTDIRRGHRLLSLTLWGALLAVSLSAQGYASWVLGAAPKDLVAVGLAGVAPRSPWIAIFGPAGNRAEYRPEFLLDTSSGRFARVKFWNPPRFTADGRWAVWLEPETMLAYSGSYELLRLDLRDPGAQPERTRMTYKARVPPLLAVSPDGRQVAVAVGRRLTLEEAPAGRLLASAELPRELDHVEDSLLFVAPGRVRIFGYELFPPAGNEPGPGALEVGEIQLTGGLRRVARIDLGELEMKGEPWAPGRPEISAGGARLLARRKSDQRCLVLDAGSGEVMAELPAGERSSASFLADGRIALVTGARSRELRIFSRDFVPERSFRFAGSGLQLGGQPAPDRLVVATGPRSLSRTQSLVLDLSTGSTRRLGGGLIPVAGPHVGPESAGPTLFLRGDGSQLVQVDLATGRQRVVAGRRAG